MKLDKKTFTAIENLSRQLKMTAERGFALDDMSVEERQRTEKAIQRWTKNVKLDLEDLLNENDN